MKTEKVIDLLKFWRDNCDLTIRHNGNLVDCKILLRNAAEKLRKNDVAINNQKHEIDALKKHVAELKKELSEREAGQRWISVEDVPVPPEKYFVFTVIPKIIIKRNPETGDPAYWMPIPKPPKKVKTYKDVFIEAFPKATITAMGRPAVCRNNIFGEGIGCKDVRCEDCWNQPYPEEEGGAE